MLHSADRAVRCSEELARMAQSLNKQLRQAQSPRQQTQPDVPRISKPDEVLIDAVVWIGLAVLLYLPAVWLYDYLR